MDKKLNKEDSPQVDKGIEKLAHFLMPQKEGEYRISWEAALSLSSKLIKAGWLDPKYCVMPGDFGTPKAKEILNEWATANGYIKKPDVEKARKEEQERIEKLIESAEELIKVIDDKYYDIDSYTTQPMKYAIYEVRQALAQEVKE